MKSGNNKLATFAPLCFTCYKMAGYSSIGQITLVPGESMNSSFLHDTHTTLFLWSVMFAKESTLCELTVNKSQ